MYRLYAKYTLTIVLIFFIDAAFLQNLVAREQNQNNNNYFENNEMTTEDDVDNSTANKSKLFLFNFDICDKHFYFMKKYVY